MKKSGAHAALLTPDAVGWRLVREGAPELKIATLAEAVAALPAGLPVHLALPSSAVLFERMTLPATDRAELAGMAELQLEKSLPFPIEEVSSDFVVLENRAGESTLLNAAVHHVPLETLCAPLRAAGRLPDKVTPFALHAAAACPADETALLIYLEQNQFVVSVAQNARLGWTQNIASAEASALLAELPQALLAAEIEGVPSRFDSVQLSTESAALAGPLRALFPVPVQVVEIRGVLPEPVMNLARPAWRAEADRQQQGYRLKQRLATGAAIYCVACAAAFAGIFWMKREVRKLDAQFAAARPELEFVQARQSRWNDLAPAIDPSRFTVELLYQLHKNLPADGVNITDFDQMPTQWKVMGEAASVNLAVDYVSRLKAEKELAIYQINAGPPAPLPGEHAQFSVFGKL